MVRVSGLLGVSLELAPRVMDAVALRDSVVLVERVDDGVRDGVLVEVPVSVPVAVCDGVGSGVGLAVRVNEDVNEGVSDDVGVPLALPPTDRVVEGDADNVDDRLGVVELLTLNVVDGVPVIVPDSEKVLLGV